MPVESVFVGARKYCLIKLLDSWSAFSRDVILISTAGHCSTRSGRHIIKSNIGSVANASILAKTQSNGKIGLEPRWHDATVAVRVINKLKPINSVEIISALGSVGSPADSLRIVRNHFAHESSFDCWQKLNAIPWFGSKNSRDVWAYLNELQIGGRSRIDLWIDDLQAIASAAVI